MFDKNLLALLGKDKKYIVFIVICNILSTISNILFTFGLVFIVNDMICQVNDVTTYLWPFLVALGSVILRFILNRLTGHFQAQLGTNAKEMLRRKIYDKVARLGVRQTDDLSLASLTQVAVEGVEQLDLYYSTYIPQFFFAVISPFILFTLLMFISIPSAVILICCVPLIPMSIIGVSKYAKKIFAKYWGQYTKMGDAFLDNISGMKELKIYHADEKRQTKMNAEAEEFRKITMKVLTMQLFSTTIMDLVAYGGAGLGIGIATLNASSINPLFDLTTPALLLFVVLSAVDFFLPLRALGSAFHVSMNGATAGKKILTLLNTKEPEWGKEDVDGYDINMKSLTFSYDGKQNILDDVNMTFPFGTLTAIVGKSGCGKSTVVSLLSGMRQNYQGNITVGTKDIRSLSRELYYHNADVVSYDTYLFHDTIRNNFHIVSPNLSDEAMYQYLKKVNLDSFVRDNGGLDLLIGEGSYNLSGGQRQRLALAIHLSAEKKIYFFDEVTSNIDITSEEIIMQNIYEMKKEKTIVLISHRLHNCLNADNIYVLDKGKIIEQGNHDALMQKEFYKKLYETQKKMEEGYKEDQEND